MSFAHLHLHTTFSFLDGYGTPEQYVSRCKEIGQPGFAITDHGNIFAHRPFYNACRKAGLKLVLGCEMYLDGGDEKYFHITVLAKDNDGYKNLCQLVSMSNDPEHFHMRPIVTLAELKGRREGLIFLTGCFGDGMPHRAWKKNPESVISVINSMKWHLGKELYLEVQHINDDERNFMRLVGEMSGLRCVATIDCHYPRREDYDAEDLMLCIGNKSMMGAVGRMKLTDNLWMMSEQEALDHGFTPDECAATHEIFDRCCVEMPQLSPIQIPNARDLLVGAVGEGAARLGSHIKNDTYRQRYLYELSIIDKLGLHSYFVVMGSVVNEFKRRGNLVGPARGSAAGSLICYLIGITEVDPIQYGLSFERFMDINRKDYPDIDTDFPPSCRDKVVEYLGETYGKSSVGRLCSFSSYRGNQVFWDIARVHGVDRSVAKLIGKAIPRLVNDEVDMGDIVEIPEVKAIINKFPMLGMATNLEGQIRQLGQHASGYAISPVPLSDVVATVRATGGEGSVLSVDKDNAESMGLLKLDILSLNTLDMLEKILAEVGMKNTDLYKMEPTDSKVLDAFNHGEVSGIFQFEGAAVRRALQAIKIESLDDLSFINAVARPGASNALSGEITVPDCLTGFIYKGKYFVYQEELMAILRFLDFGWDEVTKFRKLVSKKKVTELEGLFRDKFVTNLAKHCGESQARQFWVVVNKCGEYMFNKSHAVSYAMLGYWSMWLKVYHHDVFVKHYMDDTADDGKRREMLRECIRAGWKYSTYEHGRGSGFTVVTDQTGSRLIGGLRSIKGIGQAIASQVASGRIGKAASKAIQGSIENPAAFAPWAALDNFNNRHRIGQLPEGEISITARVWEVKDGKCIIEDIHGAEKAYFDQSYVSMESGKVYHLAVTKYRYVHIDSVRSVK